MEMVNKMTVEVRDFNLEHVFGCGQCFRWEPDADGGYTGVAFEKAVSLRHIEEDGILEIENCSEADFRQIWEPYMDLKRDYGAIKKYLSEKDQMIGEAIRYGQGIRILKQDKWEALISFIISQNNHIPRIKKCIESLCTNFGKPLGEWKGSERFTFPSAGVLSGLTEKDLEVCKLGYRARYIVETALTINSDDGAALERTEADDVKSVYEYLTGLCGVGPKVANCIMLFSMGKWEAFPIDVWVRRVMNHMYGIDEKNLAEMAAYAENHFAPYAGIAQQYLFYYIQSKGITLK